MYNVRREKNKMDPNRRHLAVPDEPLFSQVQAYDDDNAGFDDDDDDTMVFDDNTPDPYEPCGLETRERELEELGEPDQRSICFGCVYVGEREQTAMPYRDIMDIIEMGRAAIGCTDPVSLAKEMERRFEKMRRQCNRSLMPGERAIPKWRAATILDHIRSHNQDPEIQQWVQLRDIQELKEVALQAAVQRQGSTKRKRTDDKQVKVYADLVKLEWFLRRQDPQKSCFYSGGGHIDQKAMRQGLLATSGKPIVALWSNANNRSQSYQ